MPHELSEQPNTPYMESALQGVTVETLASWCSDENSSQRPKRSFAGFEITDKLDDGSNPEREVSLVRIQATGVYPQHVHKQSDALFYIKSGSAIFLSGKERRPIQPGDRIEIPRGMPHGFELAEGATLEFLSIQSPPIKNAETGEEDFHLTDMV